MKFRSVSLYSNNLEDQWEFYHSFLPNICTDIKNGKFTINTKESALTFIQSDHAFKYHYCFLIPQNKLQDALTWTENRIQIIDIEESKKTQFFESWNAESFYF